MTRINKENDEFEFYWALLENVWENCFGKNFYLEWILLEVKIKKEWRIHLFLYGLPLFKGMKKKCKNFCLVGNSQSKHKICIYVQQGNFRETMETEIRENSNVCPGAIYTTILNFF